MNDKTLFITSISKFSIVEIALSDVVDIIDVVSIMMKDVFWITWKEYILITSQSACKSLQKPDISFCGNILWELWVL